ncbi:MAG: GTP-binding protein [Candidatus Lokiarchaeota archaeon]|nr:GTP-binding protein [Candidatus Lokiarchaeota archaeon]
MRASRPVAYCFKIVIVGGGGAGKTCLFNRYCFNSFNMNTELTIGINFHSTYLDANIRDRNSSGFKQRCIVNSIFDFGGQERFKPLIPRFVKGADGALLVFDSVSYSSFQQLEYWYDLLNKKLKKQIPMILVGSKSDLLDQASPMEIVREDVIDEFMKERNLDGFYRTSALENYNVLEVFKALNVRMLEHKQVNNVKLV